LFYLFYEAALSLARKQRLSISKWVAEQLRTRIDPVYPLNYEELFGSISDASSDPQAK